MTFSEVQSMLPPTNATLCDELESWSSLPHHCGTADDCLACVGESLLPKVKALVAGTREQVAGEVEMLALRRVVPDNWKNRIRMEHHNATIATVVDAIRNGGSE